MDVENLKKIWLKDKNKEFKYKELCGILNLKEKGRGKSRTLQLKDWKRYFNFYKPSPKGQKFIVTEIYNKPKEKIDGRKTGGTGLSKGSRANNTAKYIENIEKLILDLLVQDNNNDLGFGKVFLSKNQLLKSLKMINENYAYCKQRIPKLSKFMDIDKTTVEEWYDSTSSMLERNLEIALNNLEKQSLIFWSREITVAEATALAEIHNDSSGIIQTKHYDKYDEEIIDYKYEADNTVIINHREGTDKEKTFILHTERQILKEMDCKNKANIILMGKWEKFIEKVNNIVLKELGIAFYYKSYKILFNEDHVYEVVEDLYDFELKSDARTNEQNILNKGVNDKIHKNVVKRYDKAKEKTDNIFGTTKDKKLLRRIKKSYVKDNDKLNNKLIDVKAENIKDKIRKTKINKETDKMLKQL